MRSQIKNEKKIIKKTKIKNEKKYKDKKERELILI